MTGTPRIIHVVNWTPEGVGGFEWRTTAREAADVLAALPDPTARVHVVELPDEIGEDPEGITAWLDSEGWSDGGDPRQPVAARTAEAVGPDGRLRVSPEVSGALAAIAETLSEDNPDGPDVEEARALLALLAGGMWGADTSPDPARDVVADLVTAVEAAGIEAADLDDLVHDAASNPASDVNNGGTDTQVAYLVEQYGAKGARDVIADATGAELPVVQ